MRTARFGLGRVVFAVTLTLLASTVAPAKGRLKNYPPADVTNFLHGPEYAQWLVGPLAHIATPEERQQYLGLSNDSRAEAFIESFWERRGPCCQCGRHQHAQRQLQQWAALQYRSKRRTFRRHRL